METKPSSLSPTYSSGSESACRRGYLSFSWSTVLHSVGFCFLVCVCVCVCVCVYVLHAYFVTSICPNSYFFSWFSGTGSAADVFSWLPCPKISSFDSTMRNILWHFEDTWSRSLDCSGEGGVWALADTRGKRGKTLLSWKIPLFTYQITGSL